MPERVSWEALDVPMFPIDHGYERLIQASSSSWVKVIPPDEFHSLLEHCEQADYLLLVDPARWPVGAPDLGAILHDCFDYRAATHVVVVEADSEQTRERVERDQAGQVRRVQRLYNGVNWPEVANNRTLLSIIPAQTLDGICFTSLAQLRRALSARGVLSRDVPLALDAVDLTDPGGILALNEAVVGRDVARNSQAGFHRARQGLLVGRGCVVDPSATIVGPVILHNQVTIESGVTIVGPAVVGAGSLIRQDAIIAQSTLARGTTVASGATIRHRVASGSCSGAPPDTEQASDASPFGITVPNGRSVTQSGDLAPTGASQPTRRVQLAVKRAMDVVCSLLALLVLSPLLIATAILIKLESPGPVFFVHRRERKGGKEFPCLKFRTMATGAHRQQQELYKRSEVDGPQFKMRDDPRVTGVGRWLRGRNIDELPQLINVLLGHMSLVGPRPSPFRENQICVPWRRARLSVRPGITGMWQICRSTKPEAGGFHEWIFYDIAYVRHFSIWLDLKILLATLITRGGRWSVPVSWLVRNGSDYGGYDQQAVPA
jgi:lipopolysaccharide/colanic/teichoic acid biosynthesis glycosyltransferase